jgi:hypothetical protein
VPAPARSAPAALSARSGAAALSARSSAPTAPLRSGAAAVVGSARSGAVLAAVLCLTCFLGLWVGGYLGAALLPVVTLAFTTALTVRARSRFARWLTEPFVTGGLMVVAAASAAAGGELFQHAGSGSLIRMLSDIVPQLACLVIVGRLAAAVLSERADKQAER